MWLVVRATALIPDPDGGVTLAACPDTPTRPVPWRWSVRLTGDRTAVEVPHDPGTVAVERSDHRGEDVALERDGGSVLVAVAVNGEYLVAHGTGAWQRTLGSGDVAVLEGEEPEPVRLSATDPDAELCLVRLRSTTGLPLRWVP